MLSVLFPIVEHIYANILIEETKLFSGFKDYYTGVLRNQSSDSALTTLDLFTGRAGDKQENYKNEIILNIIDEITYEIKNTYTIECL